MNYIIGPRGSGRSTYILQQREKTGGVIFTASKVSVRFLKEKAKTLGYSAEDIYVFPYGDPTYRGSSFSEGEHVYIDNFEIIFKNMLGKAMDYPKGWEFIKPTIAITTDDRTPRL